MSVVDILRRDAVAQKQHELSQTLRSHEAKTWALRAITDWLNSNANLSELAKLSLDGENESPTLEDNSAKLKGCELAAGKYFDESSIPFPTLLTADDSFTYASNHNRQSSEPSDRAQGNLSVDVVASDVTAPSELQPLPSSQSLNGSKYDTDASTSQDTDNKSAPIATYSELASREPDGPSVVLDDVAPPEPDEQADFDGATKQLLDLERPHKPAKVVHLPPEDVQEERLREIGEHRRKKSEDTESTKASRSHPPTSGELASSPSSTVGAYSTATPMPPQESPDTSPDSENGEEIEVLPPKDLRLSPEERREKDEHDRLLAAQKEIARQQALGEVADPGEQLKWEEREAAARAAEETAARDKSGGPEPDVKDTTDETMAEEIADVVDQDGVDQDEHSKQPDAATSEESFKASAASNDEMRLSTTALEEDGDTIAVTPRPKAPLTIDTSNLEQTSSDGLQFSRADQDRITTRTSSGALQKRSVSELLGRTPSQSDNIHRLAVSPETTSPMAMRHPHDTSATGPSSSFTKMALRTPRRDSLQPGQPRTPANSQLLISELAALKGASQDPDKDYLEPLFRIQAHDSPNVHTKPLGELLRSANKTVSTTDHFTSTQERLDYKMLRRVYQLQNANKWSLRQMERSVEMAQPVTHVDHMMAEMKWMRKDFRAERKMKLSVCAWLAQRCAEWVAADDSERRKLQVKVKAPGERSAKKAESAEPDLDHSGESAPEDEIDPPTPKDDSIFPTSLVVAPELSHAVGALQKSGKLKKTLISLPKAGFSEADTKTRAEIDRKELSQVSKFVKGKVLPQSPPRGQKRSRYDYEDEAETLEREPSAKRRNEELDLSPEDVDIALFHPDNKHIRDRLHANTAFRPPSEHAMPATQFYEFRSGSQWIWEDDQKLRKLAKEYSFNWSLIADELQLPPLFKSSAERRTPWECFERWVELEQLPAEMRKTMYFKTWFQRLEQSQRAAEERYQRQVALIQSQNGGNAQHVPLRRRTMPSRVDKRRNSRYLWLVDAMRKGARKKEQAAFKQAESQRAAAQRKTQNDNNQPRNPVLTPQEWSKKRYETDLKNAEIARQNRAKMIEIQRRQHDMARQQAQQQAMQQNGGVPAGPNQQRQSTGPQNMQMPAAGQQAGQQANGQFPQQNGNVNGQQVSQQQVQQQQGQRQGQMPVATRNGHLAVPQMNGQAMAAQAQMRAPNMNGQMADPAQMQRYAQQQAQAQARQQQQFGNQQNYGAMQSPNNGVGMSAQQQMQSSQAMLASLQAQMNQQQGQQQHGSNINQASGMSPSMPPPPTPHQQQNGSGQQLSSGHTPAITQFKAQIRQKFPNYTEDQISHLATQMLLQDTSQSQSKSSTQARQSATNAAAGISGVNGVNSGNNMQSYGYNQAVAYQNGSGQMVGGAYGNESMGAGGSSPQQANQQAYAAAVRNKQMQQMRSQQMHGSPAGSHASLNMNGSPSMTNVTPNSAGMNPASPNMQYNQMAMNMGGMQQRPPSRSASGTPQQRPGSAVGVPNMGQGMGSPGSANGMMQQGSPRGVQASMAR